MHLQTFLCICFLAASVASRSLPTTAESIAERNLVSRDPDECGDDDNGISKRVPCKQPVQCGRKSPSPGHLCRIHHQSTELSTAAEDRQAYTTQSVNSAVKAAKPLISKNEKSKLLEQSTTRSPLKRDYSPLILFLLFQRETQRIPDQDLGPMSRLS